MRMPALPKKSEREPNEKKEGSWVKSIVDRLKKTNYYRLPPRK